LRDIRRITRNHHAAENKIGIVGNDRRGESSITELWREATAENSYYQSPIV
jgi:hypothetical protein